MKFADLELGEVDSGQILTDTINAGAFISFGDNIGSIPPTGYAIPTLEGIKATGVAEGGKKLASGKIGTFLMRPNKIQASVVATEEMVKAKTGLVNAIWNQFPSAEIKLLENVIMGTEEKPAEWSEISTFGDVIPTELGAGTDSSVDFDDILATAKDSVVDFIVLTTAMESYLRRQRVGQTGARVFDFSSNDGVKTVNGIEYRTVVSTVAKGVAGARKNLFVSLEAYPSVLTGEEYRVIPYGTWEEIDGTVHNLNNNKIALVHESMAAAGFNPLDFAVFVPAVAPTV